MARKRKPGRPKGSKNKRKRKSSKKNWIHAGGALHKPVKKRKKRKTKATAAQLKNLKKARAALKKARSGKTRKKTGRKKATKKQLAALKLARAARELKNMPKTTRFARSDEMAATVRAPHPTSMPSILMNVRRRPAPTLVSRYN